MWVQRYYLFFGFNQKSEEKWDETLVVPSHSNVFFGFSAPLGDLLSVIFVRHGQLLATFSAARSQNATAVLSGHALAETMLVHAATIVRLKCSFHCNESFIY
jgi:hypothetical protein